MNTAEDLRCNTVMRISYIPSFLFALITFCHVCSRMLSWWAATAVFFNRGFAIQFNPSEGGGECALRLDGPGRSSGFDFHTNTIRGGPL